MATSTDVSRSYPSMVKTARRNMAFMQTVSVFRAWENRIKPYLRGGIIVDSRECIREDLQKGHVC